MQKIGVVGVGKMGELHIRELQKISEYEFVGFYDNNPIVSDYISKKYKINSFKNFSDIIANVDIIDIALPSNLQYTTAIESIKNQKHVFIEKPLTIVAEDVEWLLKLAEEAGVKVQVGHAERYNPAIIAAMPYIKNPHYIEIQRLQKLYNVNSNVSVVTNLMVHDIDVVLSINNSNIKKINVFGIKNLNPTSDFANARIEFDNGCVANITSNRLSPIESITYKFFEKDKLVNIDLIKNKSEVVNISLNDAENPLKVNVLNKISESQKNIVNEESLKNELKSFYNSIENNSKPSTSLDDSFKALKIANEIADKIKISADF